MRMRASKEKMDADNGGVMIKAVIFDMDGVIIDSEPLYLGWFQKFLEANDIFVQKEEFNRLAGCSAKMEKQLLGKWWNASENEYKTEEEIYDLFDAFYEEDIKKNPYSYVDIKDKDIDEVMDVLKRNGYKVAIASSSPMEVIKYVINQIDVEKYVDVIVSGEMFHESKPNPEIYNFTLNRLQLKPEECVAIEDSTYGIQAAKGADITTLAKKDNRFHFEQKIADEVIEDLLQIIRFLNI